MVGCRTPNQDVLGVTLTLQGLVYNLLSWKSWLHPDMIDLKIVDWDINSQIKQ